jgi:hypothetical protein
MDGLLFLPMRFGSDFLARLALGIALCWAVALALLGSTDVLLFLAPALMIAIPLLAGLYVGEKLIVRLIEGRDDERRRRLATAPAPAPRHPAVWLPRGTRLIAFSLAERPPPVRLLTQI